MNRTLLVTGGTGLIGGEVLLALAERGHQLKALVRAADDQAARARLFERLSKSQRFHPDLMSRIRAVAGNTAAPRFGLQDTDLDFQCVIHCAADTSFRESEEVWNTNVQGARNLVELGRALHPGARIVFVSTASVSTGPRGGLVGEEQGAHPHDNTYTRSKREAERIVSESALDAIILRPSIVLSRGVRDRAMARSILWAVPIMSEIGDVPVESGAHIDLVPVDYVAEVTGELATRPALRHRLYHLSAGEDAEAFGALIEGLGREFPWVRRIRAQGARAKAARKLGPLATYVPFINADVRYCNRRLRDELGEVGKPPRASSYLEELFERISLRESYEEMARP